MSEMSRVESKPGTGAENEANDARRMQSGGSLLPPSEAVG